MGGTRNIRRGINRTSTWGFFILSLQHDGSVARFCCILLYVHGWATVFTYRHGPHVSCSLPQQYVEGLRTFLLLLLRPVSFLQQHCYCSRGLKWKPFMDMTGVRAWRAKMAVLYVHWNSLYSGGRGSQFSSHQVLFTYCHDREVVLAWQQVLPSQWDLGTTTRYIPWYILIYIIHRDRPGRKYIHFVKYVVGIKTFYPDEYSRPTMY